MKLVASLIVAEVERDRYLTACVDHLLSYCDEVVLLFDGDGRWADDLRLGDRVVRVAGDPPVDFFAHEGRARQRLVDETLARNPTHVLAIDADEFVADPPQLLRACRSSVSCWNLHMEEVWELDGECLCVRQDGGWRAHGVPALWRVVQGADPARYRMPDRQLACGRIPIASSIGRRADAGTSILHFGWANRYERQARYDRYAVADGGRFHASAHLESILWPDDRVVLEGRPWPAGLAPVRAELVARVARPLAPLPS